MAGLPDAEVEISEGLVRTLLGEQVPELATLRLKKVANGWDNEMYRLGHELAVRIPRRQIGADLLRNEQRWLPELSGRLHIDIPAPVFAGRPSADFPWFWSVVPWFDGKPATEELPEASEATRVASFLLALHQPAPAGAPSNPVRGVPLASQSDKVMSRIQRLESAGSVPAMNLGRVWQRATAAATVSDNCWIHGDFHAGNVIVDSGCLAAIIDWGDVCGGDVATDLVVAWSLFDDDRARWRFFDTYAADETTWLRATGWGVYFGTVLVEAGLVNSPAHARQGYDLLERLNRDVR